MELSDIAAVSGKGGLFKVINPTRTGAILETLDGTQKKLVVGMNAKVSVLSDISIYTTDQEGAVPLQAVLKKIHEEFDGDTGLDKNSPVDELNAFLKHVLPEYDESRVYSSDIRKIVSWYNQLIKVAPEVLMSSNDKKEDKKEEKNVENQPKNKE